MKRSKNTKLPTTYKTTSFLRDPKDSACTYEIWEEKRKEKRKLGGKQSDPTLKIS